MEHSVPDLIDYIVLLIHKRWNKVMTTVYTRVQAGQKYETDFCKKQQNSTEQEFT